MVLSCVCGWSFVRILLPFFCRGSFCFAVKLKQCSQWLLLIYFPVLWKCQLLNGGFRWCEWVHVTYLTVTKGGSWKTRYEFPPNNLMKTSLMLLIHHFVGASYQTIFFLYIFLSFSFSCMLIVDCRKCNNMQYYFSNCYLLKISAYWVCYLNLGFLFLRHEILRCVIKWRLLKGLSKIFF